MHVVATLLVGLQKSQRGVSCLRRRLREIRGCTARRHPVRGRAVAEEVLPKVIGEVSDSDSQSGLEKHVEGTRGHVENVERVCEVAATRSSDAPASTG